MTSCQTTKCRPRATTNRFAGCELLSLGQSCDKWFCCVAVYHKNTDMYNFKLRSSGCATNFYKINLAHTMSTEEEDDTGSKPVSVVDVTEDIGNVDAVFLEELENIENSMNTNKMSNWRSVDSDLALAEEVQKAEAHLASRGERGKRFKQVRQQMGLRGYNVQNYRTVQARFNQLIEDLEMKNVCGRGFEDDKEEELKSLLKDMKDQMETLENEKMKENKENMDPKDMSKEGQFLRDQSALLVLGEALQRAGGSKLVLGKDGQIMVETSEGGAPMNVASLLHNDTAKGRKKKGGSELLQGLLEAAGQNTENNREIELHKLDLMIEQSKQQHELEMKKLDMEMAENRVRHEIEMKKLQMEIEARREDMAVRMMELEQHLLRHKNEK